MGKQKDQEKKNKDENDDQQFVFKPEKQKAKKRKPIHKPENPNKQDEKNQRENKRQQEKNTMNSKRGRPVKHKKNDDNSSDDLRFNQLDLIKNSFIKYLYVIGFKKGLVFTQENRKKMSKQQTQNKGNLPEIKWDPQHFWNYEEQVDKAREIIDNILMEKISNQKKLKLIEELLQMGDIFPREITAEIYKILCFLYNIVIQGITNKIQKSKKQEMVRKYAEVLWNDKSNYYFLTGKFSNIFKAEENKQIEKELMKLFEEITKYLSEIYLMKMQK